MAKAKINPEFTYKTRDGQDVTDVRFNNEDDSYPIYADVDGWLRSYTIQGYYYNVNNVSDFDLIKQPVKKTKPVAKPVKKEVMKTAGTTVNATTIAPEVNQVQTQGVQHKHHDMIVAWAKNPKLEVEMLLVTSGKWTASKNTSWHEEFEYRFKPEEPKLLTIIGADGKARSYPEPCKVIPEVDSVYYTPSVTNQPSCVTWMNDHVDNDWFNTGIVHLTEEAAELHAKAMLGID